MSRKAKRERRVRDQSRRSRSPGETDRGRGRERFVIHWVIGTGWIHTHGMAERGFPEVEVREVPDFLGESAADLIRSVCDYMLDAGTRIKPGEYMETSPRTSFRLVKPEPLPGQEDHYAMERLQIVDLERSCDCCGHVPPGRREAGPGHETGEESSC